MRRLLVTCGVLSALLIAAGCGSGGGGSTVTSSSALTKVDMKGSQFDPETLTVKKGSTVEWVNQDSVDHDVTKNTGPGPRFSSGSGNLGNGDTYKVTFNTPGTISYECTVHPGMTGTIVVR
jgi:plastocyanin